MPMPPIHLTILQPAGYVHSLGFLDQARYLRHQFRRLGAQVTLAKNRLRPDAVNLLFGAHLLPHLLPQPELRAQWLARHTCVLINLEQLGHGGATVSADYLNLLRQHAVVDYDPANLSAYLNPSTSDPADVPLISFQYAPYLADAQPLPLEERPIDLLFFGSMNPRRQAFMTQVEAAGVEVTTFDHPIYGPERDHFIRQSKAVLNCHFYATSRFEQARAFHCLSLGTPVISERGPATQAPAAFDEAVFWLEPERVTTFFAQEFGRARFFDAARQRLAQFSQQDPIEQYADLLAFCTGYRQAWLSSRGNPTQQATPASPWQPSHVNLGSGKDYKPGWLNLDILPRAEPDLVLDLGQPQPWPQTLAGAQGGEVTLAANSLTLVYANNVLEHVPDLPTLMGNVLTLLQEGGEFHIEVPYEKALTAWQDPTHLRALNENSWLYYTDWFWYLGWMEHRFEIAQFQWLDARLQHLPSKADAAFMKLILRKIATSPRERTVARAMRADFGGVDDDELAPDAATAVTVASSAAVAVSDGPQPIPHAVPN